MSVRVVLAVVFAVVLLGAVSPAVQDARHARKTAAALRATDAVSEAAASLVEAGEPPPEGTPGARRMVTVRLPPETALVFSAGSRVARLTIDGEPGRRVALPVGVDVPGDSLTVRGRVDLTIAYERRDGRPVLVITRGQQARVYP